MLSLPSTLLSLTTWFTAPLIASPSFALTYTLDLLTNELFDRPDHDSQLLERIV